MTPSATATTNKAVLCHGGSGRCLALSERLGWEGVKSRGGGDAFLNVIYFINIEFLDFLVKLVVCVPFCFRVNLWLF